MTITGVTSNLYITESQIIEYAKKLDIYTSQESTIKLWLHSVSKKRGDCISISSFIKLLSSNAKLSSPLFNLRQFIIANVIGTKEWRMIIKRRNFYNNNKMILQTKIPKEPCFDSFKRKMITHQPPPYFCDYRPDPSNDVGGLDMCIAEGMIDLRKKYGYSSRQRLSSRASSRVSSSAISTTPIERVKVSTTSIPNPIHVKVKAKVFTSVKVVPGEVLGENPV